MIIPVHFTSSDKPPDDFESGEQSRARLYRHMAEQHLKGNKIEIATVRSIASPKGRVFTAIEFSDGSRMDFTNQVAGQLPDNGLVEGQLVQAFLSE